MLMFSKIRNSELFRLIQFIKPHRWSYSIGLAGNIVVGVSFNILVAFIFKDLFGAAVKADMSLLIRAVLFLVAGLLLLSALAPIFNNLFYSSVVKIMADIRIRLFRHVTRLPVRYYEQNHTGDMVSRITNDVWAIERVYSDQLQTTLSVVAQGVSAIIIMLIQEWRIAIILVLLGISSVFINKAFSKVLRKIGDNNQKYLGLTTERITDLLAGFNIIKMFPISQLIGKRFDEANTGVKDSMYARSVTACWMRCVNNLIANLGSSGVLALGAFMVLHNYTSFGIIIMMTQLLNSVSSMFTNFGGLMDRFQYVLAGAGRVLNLLDEPGEPEKYDVSGPKDMNNVIEMKNISFFYEKDKMILDGLNISVKKDEIAALVGTSGGGKSTVAKLLLGFYSPESGSISINEKPLSQYTLVQLRDLIAYVPQDAYLFDDTIEQNIRYGRLDASKDEIIAAAKAANAHDFIMEFPDGYNTNVGERAVRISGGQRQRIAIARAILRDAPILLLDEATSSLDSESEQLVQEALNVLMKGRTVIIIAHRLSTIEKADVIYVIDEGRVLEQGRHEELVGSGGLYNSLYELQFQQDEVVAAG